MDCNTIKKILDKYWEGETSVEEEAMLRTYFNGNNVAKELKRFQPLFIYYKEQKEKTSTQSFESLTKQRIVHRLLPNWLAIAASILMLISVGTFYQWNQNNREERIMAVDETMKDTYKDPKVAYQEAKAALLLISKGLNKGMEKTKEGVKKAKK